MNSNRDTKCANHCPKLLQTVAPDVPIIGMYSTHTMPCTRWCWIPFCCLSFPNWRKQCLKCRLDRHRNKCVYTGEYPHDQCARCLDDGGCTSGSGSGDVNATTRTTTTSGEEYYYAWLLRILFCTFTGMCTSDDNNNGSYALANLSMMMIYNIHPTEKGCTKMAKAHYDIIWQSILFSSSSSNTTTGDDNGDGGGAGDDDDHGNNHTSDDNGDIEKTTILPWQRRGPALQVGHSHSGWMVLRSW